MDGKDSVMQHQHETPQSHPHKNCSAPQLYGVPPGVILMNSAASHRCAPCVQLSKLGRGHTASQASATPPPPPSSPSWQTEPLAVALALALTLSASSIAVPSMPISPLLSPCCFWKARGLILRARIWALM
jgi:hypothetical protein